jgi:hypothetical protein
MPTTRLDELRTIDPVLTTIAQGYRNSGMVAESLFPTVQVSKAKGKIPQFGKDAFIERNLIRATRAQSNRIPPSDIELIEFETIEHDIEIAIDYIEEEESLEFYRYEQSTAKQLMDVLLNNKEKEAAALALDASLYDTEMKITLTSDNAFNNAYSTISPITVILNGINAIHSRIGLYPNTIIIGVDAYKALLENTYLLERIKYTGIPGVTQAFLKEIFNVKQLEVGASVYSEDGSTFSNIWSDNVVIAYVDKNEHRYRSEFNPSFGYTLQREGKPEIDTYYENGGKIKVIRNTDNYCLKVTSRDAAYLIKDTVHSFS